MLIYEEYLEKVTGVLVILRCRHSAGKAGQGFPRRMLRSLGESESYS